ncbi:MAG: acetolactate synthase small subunit [Clostridia bacterium]|nr:acetolactate synthase small subunit [Clostridia bacterium]
MAQKESKHLIMVKVDNRPGVLSRITGLFTRRGYNIESLVTGMTQDPSIYHITVAVIGTDDDVELLARQLERCMEVICVKCDGGDDWEFVQKEMLLIRIPCDCPEKRVEIMNMCSLLSCKTAGVGKGSVIVEVSGDTGVITAALRSFEIFGEIEVIHSGTVGIDMY